jgi:hypothetical protein
MQHKLQALILPKLSTVLVHSVKFGAKTRAKTRAKNVLKTQFPARAAGSQYTRRIHANRE